MLSQRFTLRSAFFRSVVTIHWVTIAPFLEKTCWSASKGFLETSVINQPVTRRQIPKDRRPLLKSFTKRPEALKFSLRLVSVKDPSTRSFMLLRKHFEKKFLARYFSNE